MENIKKLITDFKKNALQHWESLLRSKIPPKKCLQWRSGRLKRPSRALQSLQKVPNGVPNGAQIHAKIDLQAKYPLQDPPQSDLGVPTAPFWTLWGAILDHFRTIFTSRFSRKKTTTNTSQKKKWHSSPLQCIHNFIKNTWRDVTVQNRIPNQRKKNIRTHTAISILGSGHCGGVGAQRIEILHT